ncbi:NAD(P)-dependent oxidoreductase [Acidithiobacillus acidisediminis]|uniref:NAD-dependent epimerase/dehydratase family protein n=1 Tax=Acidithiobacillus TaxID=119977 RepID=UPI00200F1226|nr:NAD(P)-dependent oxidoreductase [Acidithiobacillus sp. S30A2]
MLQDINQYNAAKARQILEYFHAKRVLITGGFGFVGGHMARRLLDCGAEVTVLDIDTSPSRPSMINCGQQGMRDQVQVVEADVTDKQAMQEVIEAGRFHYIFHFAAYASVIEKALTAPYDTIMANTMGWINILEACRMTQHKPNMIFLSSTDKVYGEMDGDSYFEHTTPLRGIGVYDSAKLAADVFSRTYHEAFGLPTVTLRMCNIYGPYDFNSAYRLLPKAMQSIYGGPEPVAPELYFDAIEHHRDYLYVEDLVQAILLLAHCNVCRGEVYNLAGGTYLSTPTMLRTIVEACAEVEGGYDQERAARILANGIAVRVSANASTVHAITKQHLNGEKLMNDTGFHPADNFVETLKETINFYRDYFLASSVETKNEQRLAG